jgi:hypothetical protein
MSALSREVEYMAVYLLKKRVAALEEQLKAKYADGVKAPDGTVLEKGMRPGERKAVVVELEDGTEVELGGITRSKPTPAWKVTDPQALDAWIRENQPDVVETVTQQVVPEWFVANLLNAAKATGAAVSDGGEEIPGIALVTGSSYVAPKPSGDADQKLEELVRAGALSWSDVLAIEAAS